MSLNVVTDPGSAGLVFDERGLIPAVVQEGASGEVLMVAYMNREALEKTLATGQAWFYSRSRRELWEKGATSGNRQEVKAVYFDCDADTLLLQVKAAGPACHRGNVSCFEGLLARREEEGPGGAERSGEAEAGAEAEAGVEGPGEAEGPGGSEGREEPAAEPLASFPFALEDIIRERRQLSPQEGKSYVASLFGRGQDAVLKKIGEEAGEVIIAAKNGSREELVYEAADLLFHLLMVLQAGGTGYRQVLAELKERHRQRGEVGGTS